MIQISTEDRLDADQWVDQLDTESALKVMLDNQAEAIAALHKVLPQITKAVKALHTRLASSDTGRLVYIGAGTSARIGVQDGAELLPTFGWPDRRIAFIIAGGEEALLQPVENAEDEEWVAEADITRLTLGPNDCLIGLAASGRTPFTCAGIRAARSAGCLTVGISNNHSTPLLDEADYPICLATGAEALAGSTRLKAGTAQKICLNLLSTQLMVLLGRVKHGLMTEMTPRNAKLKARHAGIQALLAAEAGTPD